MGQAAVDLPKTAERVPAPLASADDLLSQLAGAEIDRMLAAAEPKQDSPPEPSGPPASEMREATQSAQDAYAAEVDQLFKHLNAPSEQPPVAPAAVSEPAAPAAAPTAAEAAPEIIPTENVATPDAPAPPPAPPNLDPPRAFSAPVAVPIPHAEIAAPQPITVAQAIESAVQQVKQQRASLLVRVLELINLPLERCPDAARDLVGKLAILTFMNAIGVLLYIALFRR
jgi:hypothetical protein